MGSGPLPTSLGADRDANPMNTVSSLEFRVLSSGSSLDPKPETRNLKQRSNPKPETRNPKPLGLYIHIPFCASRCHYCDFNTYRFDPVQAEQYLEGLAREFELRAAMPVTRDRQVCSVFLGGGTPSILDASQIVRILDRCRAAFAFE